MSIVSLDGKRATPGYGATVAVCIPSQDQVNMGFALDLATLVRHVTHHRPDLTLRLLNMRSTLICDGRENLVKEALAKPCDYLFWLDSDMRVPADALLQLLAHDQPIVAANYATRRHPTMPTAEIRDQGLVYSGADATGLVTVDRVGMGVMLVKADVYRQVPQPWHLIGYSPKSGNYSGEDVYFCRKAAQHGVAVQVDLKLSAEVGHVGEFTYRMEHAWVAQQVLREAAPQEDAPVTGVAADGNLDVQ